MFLAFSVLAGVISFKMERTFFFLGFCPPSIRAVWRGEMRTRFCQNYFLGKGFAKTSADLFLNLEVASGGGVWGGIRAGYFGFLATLEKQEIIYYTINIVNYFISMDCIFCKIAKGEAPAHKIWEDEKHLAFLSIFPNTEGFSVVITKDHYPSYPFDLSEEVLIGIVNAAKQTAKLLDAKLGDVGRTGMIFEGFGVDHVHAKLFPMHGTKMSEWKPLKSNIDKYFEKYEGYISSHDYKRADDEKLAELAKKIRE